MGFGDEVMVTGHVREIYKRDPRKVRIVYEKPRWNEAWHHNPKIAKPAEEGDFQEFRPRQNYLRPYCVSKSHEKWVWKEYGPPVGEFYFTKQERDFGARYSGRVILEPLLKPGASLNKQWGLDPWTRVALALSKRNIRVTQIGASTPTLLPGAEYLQTRSLRLAAALIAHAKAVLVPEGGLHHVAAAVGCPAVVIFGGYISPKVTGYASQVNLFQGDDLGCGMRVSCQHCVDAMRSITVDRVLTEFLNVLDRPYARQPQLCAQSTD